MALALCEAACSNDIGTLQMGAAFSTHDARVLAHVDV